MMEQWFVRVVLLLASFLLLDLHHNDHHNNFFVVLVFQHLLGTSKCYHVLFLLFIK